MRVQRAILALTATIPLLSGCMPMRPASSSATMAPLVIPPLKKGALRTDPLVVRFNEGAAPPSGCFARSRRTGAVACAVGHYRVGTEWGERHVAIISNGEETFPDVPLKVLRTDAGLKLETQTQRTLDALMLAGDFITLAAPEILPPDSPRSFGALTIELRRDAITTSPVSTWDLKVVVLAQPRDTEESDDPVSSYVSELLTNTLTATSECIDPNLSVRMLEPATVLIERECRVEEAGDTEVMLGAWLCDSDRSRCD